MVLIASGIRFLLKTIQILNFIITGETYVQYKGVTYRNAKADIVIDPGETNFDWRDIFKYDLEQIEPGLVDINEEFIKDKCKLIISNLTVYTSTPNND
jgi:hypothetical protein